MNRFRTFLACTLLALFALTKAAPLHAMTHAETDFAAVENCSWCHLTASSHEEFYLVAKFVDWEPTPFVVVVKEVCGTHKQIHITKPLPTSLFSRPPPVIA